MREKGESKQQVKYLCILMRQNEWFDFDEKMSTKEMEEQTKKKECALGTDTYIYRKRERESDAFWWILAQNAWILPTI